MQHVGGKPSIVQRALISRAARMALHLELLDERTLGDGKPLTTHDHKHYVAWSNALTRLLGQLGVTAAPPPQPSLREVLADLATREGAAA